MILILWYLTYIVHPQNKEPSLDGASSVTFLGLLLELQLLGFRVRALLRKVGLELLCGSQPFREHTEKSLGFIGV